MKQITVQQYNINVSKREMILIRVALESVHESFMGLLLDSANEDLQKDADLVLKMIQRIREDEK